LDELTQRIQRRVSTLHLGLQAHINRVRDIAVELAPHHGVDPDRAALGMLAHDVARAMSNQELLNRAVSLGLSVGTVENHVPVLLHGPVGAELLRREDGLTDQSLHQAVYWHTTAHPSLDTLGKIVFLSDKLDPQKIKRYPYQPYLRELAFADLDRAILEFLTRESISQVNRGEMVHPAMVETRNHLIAVGQRARASV
jgi:predicted HD superfamily hydrolase involved in NAD metabolism